MQIAVLYAFQAIRGLKQPLERGMVSGIPLWKLLLGYRYVCII